MTEQQQKALQALESLVVEALRTGNTRIFGKADGIPGFCRGPKGKKIAFGTHRGVAVLVYENHDSFSVFHWLSANPESRSANYPTTYSKILNKQTASCHK